MHMTNMNRLYCTVNVSTSCTQITFSSLIYNSVQADFPKSKEILDIFDKTILFCLLLGFVERSLRIWIVVLFIHLSTVGMFCECCRMCHYFELCKTVAASVMAMMLFISRTNTAISSTAH